jgi:alpha-galactosidase
MAAIARGQASSATIRYDAAAKVFRIDAADVTYVIGINEKKELQTLYWGKRLAADDPFMPAHSHPGSSAFDIPVNATAQEFVAWGQGLYVEPNLKVSFPDGNRDLVLEYVSHLIENDTLTIVLKDISREVYVAIEYKVDSATGILRRSARVENKTAGPITIEQISAATWNLPRGTDYQLRYLTGRWDAEWNLEQQPVRPGKTVLESRRGSTGSQNNPWFAIESGSSKDEDFGNVWFGALGGAAPGRLPWSRIRSSRSE